MKLTLAILALCSSPAFAADIPVPSLTPIRNVLVQVKIYKYIFSTRADGITVTETTTACGFGGVGKVYDADLPKYDHGYGGPADEKLGSCETVLNGKIVRVSAEGMVLIADFDPEQKRAFVDITTEAEDKSETYPKISGSAATATLTEKSLIVPVSGGDRGHEKDANYEYLGADVQFIEDDGVNP